ncbi:MAG: lysine biosynthesis protein LysW [Candidatus Dormiibacterota bacterium]
MTTDVSIAVAECPECAGLLGVPRGTVVGEILPCAECSAELEVTGLAPLTVALAPEVEEDWGE